jgi:amidase/aspartyl-tRNA(Asn)/glutamyl-tRNA(Gln) amidotransferase subunit A
VSPIGHGERVTNEIPYASVAGLRHLLDRGELSVAELTSATLHRIDTRNAEVSAVVQLRAEGALADAAEADGVAAGERGPLHGIPVLIKDANETVDMPTSYGSMAMVGFESGYDAVAVERLRAAGMIVIGKTNSPEFGLRPTTSNGEWGPTRNPWDTTRTAGGSSGGAAAALALGMVPVAQGSDGGGSCRIPASCCGVVGLKPSRGLIPWAPVAYEYWAGLATNGPLARTVADSRLLLEAMAGPVPGEPYGVSRPTASAADTGRRRVVGVSTRNPHGDVDPRIVAAVQETARAFEEQGWAVEEIDLDLSGLAEPFMTVLEGNSAATVEGLVGESKLHLLENNTLALAMRGKGKSAGDYAAAVSTMRNRSASLMIATEPYDIVLTPTLTQLPQPIDGYDEAEDNVALWNRYLEWLGFTYPTNCTGQPAISLPGGLVDGLPVGVQLVGRMGDDEGVLAAAEVIEQARPWAQTYLARFGEQ